MLSLSAQARFQPLKKCRIVSLDTQEPLERSRGRWHSFVLLVRRQLAQPPIFPLAGVEQPHGTSDPPDVSYGRTNGSRDSLNPMDAAWQVPHRCTSPRKRTPPV